jgi:hypothetical protein
MFSPTPQTIWQEMIRHAAEAGLDAGKFTSAHQEIVQQIVAFLHTSPPSVALPTGKSRGWRIARRSAPPAPSLPASPPPIIICGEPGTGKTTFLYLLDTILRRAFALPDHIQPTMTRPNGRSHPIAKRAFNGTAVSLLSVKKWDQLLHFYAWDVAQHKLDNAALDQFIATTLAPMRVLFADEVEMTGYSPTIPNLARHGLLVVGSSNQYSFQQLVDRAIPPHIYRFHGVDMRLGDPMDAVALPADHLSALFARVQRQPRQQQEQLVYQALTDGAHTFLAFDFQNAVQAPMLETDWIQFWQQFLGKDGERETAVILLFDHFSLDILRADYNAIIRFVALFDAIEQVGLGVLVQNQQQEPQLSRAAITNLKTHIYNAIGVPEEVKQRTVVGLDRCTSRLGQAGHKARELLDGNHAG